MAIDKWDEESTRVAMEMAGRGCRARDIAGTLGEGFTRSSVIAKLSRMGIKLSIKRDKSPNETRAHQSKRKAGDAAKQVYVPFVPAVYEPLPGAPSEGVSFMDRRRSQCAWPLSSGMFCGARIDGNHPSYCEAHRAIGTTTSKVLDRPAPIKKRLISRYA